MKKKINSFILLVMLVLCSSGFAQTDVILEEINYQIWDNFTQAFQNKDFQLFESLHHPDLIRVNGNADILLDKENYLVNYKQSWEVTDNNLDINFRFLERIYSNTAASERGIYKLTVNANLEDEKTFYGKFHVLMRKENGQWQFVMDYDSDENRTIGEKDYLMAHDKADFDKY